MPNNAESCKLNRYNTKLFVNMGICTAKENINKYQINKEVHFYFYDYHTAS